MSKQDIENWKKDGGASAMKKADQIHEYLNKYVIPEFKDAPPEAIICALHLSATSVMISRNNPHAKMSAIVSDLKVMESIKAGLVDIILQIYKKVKRI